MDFFALCRINILLDLINASTQGAPVLSAEIKVLSNTYCGDIDMQRASSLSAFHVYTLMFLADIFLAQ